MKNIRWTPCSFHSSK